MLTKSTFTDFPNLWVGSSLTNLTKISDANPQQKDYNWGNVELVRWTSSDGVALKGLLFKPENFDPKKKYPMVTYFYEINSNTLNSYVPPNGRNSINYTHYVSNGYLVFVPDIVYETGYPGPSAVKAVVPGVEMLLARGYVDPKGLGIQGHSWGGYQTAYIITQSHLFSAAMAGAPVANMTSAYGGIRWGSGINRAGQYEGGQSRIGKPVIEAPELYIKNSPLFWLDRVTTPLFILARRHGRRGAVVSGHRAVRRHAAAGEGGVPDRLQQRPPQPGEPREPARHRDAHAAVLRQQAERRAGAGLDGARHSVRREGQGPAWSAGPGWAGYAAAVPGRKTRRARMGAETS